jgi:hypothetical protein
MMHASSSSGSILQFRSNGALAILDVFGEDGLRAYIVGHVEGVADAMEGLEEGDDAIEEADE